MEKSRKNKMLAIVALIFAIAALTLGFASFSKIMKISSSATASLPSDENFNVELYGSVDSNDINKISENLELDFSLLSKTEVYAWDLNNKIMVPKYSASIDNENFTIDINNLELTGPGDLYVYYVTLKNNSPYSVYTYLSEDSLSNFISYSKGWTPNSCVASENTSDELVTNTCNNIRLVVDHFTRPSIDGYLYDGDLKVPAGDYTTFGIIIGYAFSDIRADGNFNVNFDPLKFQFDLVPHTYSQTTSIEEDA